MVKTLSGCITTTILASMIAAALAGCQQPQTPNEKQARLLAAENLQIKKQWADQQAKLENLQKQQAQELQQGQRELARCHARAEQLQKDLDKGIAERVRDVATKVMDENARLRKEIERLESEIDGLKSKTP